ncbi:MAG: cell division protein FtsZ [Verrucomicrobiae bacterium]|nr:cell division protein FtsZ [Verrucomicrobiae bacterium]
MNSKTAIPNVMERTIGGGVHGPGERKMRIRVVGVGGAGLNAVDHLAANPPGGVSFMAVNTDTQSLGASMIAEKLQIGKQLTRGLGAGGDPDLGRRAALEDEQELRDALEGCDVVFLAAGLGGGTGTGAGPVVAKVAREEGALVLAFVTLPFSHEGEYRGRVANDGLAEMKQSADAVVCIPNDKLLVLASEETSVLDAFKPADEYLGQSVRRIWGMLSQGGLINIDFADLRSVLRRQSGETLIGFGEADGPDRIQQVVDRTLKGPLLSGDDLLGRATSMLVAVTHGPDFTMKQLQKLLEEIRQRMGPKVACKQGIVVSGDFVDRLSLMVIASTGTPLLDKSPESAAPADAPAQPEKSAPAPRKATDEKPVATRSGGRVGGREKAEAKVKGAETSPAKQGLFDLDSSASGIFAKGEHTVVNGQDLDVPTFIRRGLVIRSL